MVDISSSLSLFGCAYDVTAHPEMSERAQILRSVGHVSFVLATPSPWRNAQSFIAGNSVGFIALSFVVRRYLAGFVVVHGPALLYFRIVAFPASIKSKWLAFFWLAEGNATRYVCLPWHAQADSIRLVPHALHVYGLVWCCREP